MADAALIGEQDLSVLFSFTRSHFHVEAGPPARLVRFLHELMPEKRMAELYIAIGFHKHGKTELYRDLLRHLRTTDDRFELAQRTPGLVMIVFTMPGFDVVVKVIRDRFPPSKSVTREAVMRSYRLVFRHDRAGPPGGGAGVRAPRVRPASASRPRRCEELTRQRRANRGRGGRPADRAPRVRRAAGRAAGRLRARGRAARRVAGGGRPGPGGEGPGRDRRVPGRPAAQELRGHAARHGWSATTTTSSRC